MKDFLIVIADDDDDQILLQDAFVEIGYNGRFKFVGNGSEFLDYLRDLHHPVLKLADIPSLILLDLNMPKMGGAEALNVIKSDNLLKVIPVVIFSTSGSKIVIDSCYNLGANSYIVKPLKFESLLNTACAIKDYWLTTASHLKA